MEIIRKTRSLCNKCYKYVPAKVVVKKNEIYLIKECEHHCNMSVLLRRDSDYYKSFENNRKFLISKLKKVRNRCECIRVFLTNKINQGKPKIFKDITIEDINNLVAKYKNILFNLTGGEPTLRKDLIAIIKIIKKSGNDVLLNTDGIKISDFDYLKSLNKAGLEKIMLKFDGFNDKNQKESLNKVKTKALKNIKKLKLKCIIDSFFSRQSLEEIKGIFEYILKNDFIAGWYISGKEVKHKDKLGYNQTLLGNDILKIFEKITNNRISKEEVIKFNKIITLIYSSLKIKKCLYHSPLFIFRKNGDFITLSELLNKNINIELKTKKVNNLNIVKLGLGLINKNTFGILTALIKNHKVIDPFTFQNGFSLVFENGCDLMNCDLNLGNFCHQDVYLKLNKRPLLIRSCHHKKIIRDYKNILEKKKITI